MQVFIREKQLHGNHSKLIRAEVISNSGSRMQVKRADSGKVVEVQTKDVVPASLLYGGQPGVTSRASDRRITKQYPESRSALGNMAR